MIDLTLDSLKIPGIIGYVPPFGTKVEKGKGLSTSTVNNNVIMALAKQRAVIVSSTDETSKIEYDAKLILTQPNITLTVGIPAYEGCSVRIAGNFPNTSDFAYIKLNGINYKIFHRQTWVFIAISGIFKSESPPVGFIYVQLPGKDIPLNLWPGTTWSDISGSFAGGFFRAKGGNADSTGARQGDAIRNITGRCSGVVGNLGNFSGVLRGTDYEGRYPAAAPGGGYQGFDIDVSRGVPTAEENRPINYAVTVWQCTAV